MNTLGVVLCGGKSSRMGTDKGLIQKGNLTWAERAYVKLSLLSVPVVVSINSDQESLYRNIFSEEVLVKDSLSIGGPLNGILSVHKQFPSKNLIVLACDIVNMDGKIIQQLYDAHLLRKDEFDFFVYKNNGYFEPLCGIYSFNGLKTIFQDLETGKIEKFSMKNILEKGKTFALEITEEENTLFLNVNQPETLESHKTNIDRLMT